MASESLPANGGSMRKRIDVSPAFLFCIVALLLVAGSAHAQMYCDECDPYSSYCSDACYRCTQPGPDPGTCRNTPTLTTCGDSRILGGNCLQSGCTPNFVDTSRVVQGTYANNYYLYCDHHKVEWVTQQDANHCNENSYWWTRYDCQDSQDGYKILISNVATTDCCDGSGPDGVPDPLYTCNHYHSCTG